MGLFDELAGGLLGGGGGGGQGAGEPGAPAQAGGAGQVMGAVLQMLQQRPGGVGGVLSSFEHAGLGGAAQSWMQDGPNQAVSPNQVSQALGPDAVGDLASKLGVSHEEAAGHLSQQLPQIMDHLNPGGQAPADGGMGAIEGLLSRFGGGGR